MFDEKELSDVGLVRYLSRQIYSETGCKVLINEPLALRTSFEIGGVAKFYTYPPNIEALQRLVQFCGEKGLELFTIGYGTNLLISDEGFNGCVVDISLCCNEIKIEGNLVKVGGGVWLGDVVQLTANKGLQGLEKLMGIPGGIGGALSMNAGAFRTFISDFLLKVEVIEPNGELKTMTKSDIQFGYRTAPGLHNKIVISANFELNRGNPEQLQRIIEETLTERYRRNVMILPSCGSVFRNPPGHFAAQLIEAVGGKGMREGGVQVSPLHANFIVNINNGTATDVARLIKKIRQKVNEQFGINLELEVRTLGFKDLNNI